MPALFQDRGEAGRQLAERLRPLVAGEPTVVLALPPGGVQVASEIAAALHAPLDVFVVRKLSVPEHKGLALGAVATGGTRLLDDGVIARHRVRGDSLHDASVRELRELERIEREYRQGRPYPSLRSRVLIVVDDGVVTGATMVCAVLALRGHRPARIVAAAPVMSPRGAAVLSRVASACVALTQPSPMRGIDAYYRHSGRPTEREVALLLADSASARRGRNPAADELPDEWSDDVRSTIQRHSERCRA